MKAKASLDERELQILQALWVHGPQKPSDLQPRLSFQMKNGALRWLLNDLVARGLLTRRKAGKAFFYTAEIERRSLLESLGKRLRDILFGGSALAMIGELAESQKISAKDLAYLHKVAVKPRPAGKRKS